MTDELEVEQRFATVPEWLLHHAQVSDAGVRLYAILQRYGNSSGERMPGRAELAGWMHCSVDKVTRATESLELIGALRVKRSKAITKGESGVARHPNRYFLRTTDPTVGHALPPTPPRSRKSAATPSRTDAATVAAPLRPYRREELTNPTTQTAERRSFKQVVVAISETDQRTLGDLLELAAQLRTIRVQIGKPTRPWGDVHVARAVVKALTAGHEPKLIRPALIHLAHDPATRFPYRLEHDGPWWETAVLDARRTAKHAAHEEKQQTVAACRRCDEYGWLLTDDPDFNVHCDHELGDIRGAG